MKKYLFPGIWYYQLHKRQTQLPRIFAISNLKVGWLLFRKTNQRGHWGCGPMKLKLSVADSVKWISASASSSCPGLAGLSSVNWPGQNKLGIQDLNWKWKFLATVIGVYVIAHCSGKPLFFPVPVSTNLRPSLSVFLWKRNGLGINPAISRTFYYIIK